MNENTSNSRLIWKILIFQRVNFNNNFFCFSTKLFRKNFHAYSTLSTVFGEQQQWVNTSVNNTLIVQMDIHRLIFIHQANGALWTMCLTCWPTAMPLIHRRLNRLSNSSFPTSSKYVQFWYFSVFIRFYCSISKNFEWFFCSNHFNDFVRFFFHFSCFIELLKWQFFPFSCYFSFSSVFALAAIRNWSIFVSPTTVSTTQLKSGKSARTS